MPTPSSLFYVRPGSTSYAWSYAGTSMPAGGANWNVLQVAFDASSLLNQQASRGDLQYSLDAGKTWTTYTIPVDGQGAYVAAAGTLWRFQDKQAGDSVTPDGFTARYKLADGSIVAENATVVPDTQPVGLQGANDTVFSTMGAGDVVDVLSAVDTGSQVGGRWVIDSQSVSGLFSIAYDPLVDTSARLVVADPARIPETGLAASVTIHYYDRYQIDAATGKPLNSTAGVTRTLNYTIEDGNTDSLPGLSNESKLGVASGSYSANPALATLSTGGIVAVWQGVDKVAGGAGYGLWAQLRDAGGKALGGAFALTADGDATVEGQPAVAALAGGRFIVAYAVSNGGADKIAYRVVEANGSAGPERVIDAGAAGDAAMPSLAALSDGSVALAWRSGGMTHVQQVGGDGALVGTQQDVGMLGSAYSPSIAALPSGGWVVSWGEMNDGNVYAALKGGAVFLASGDGYAASYTTVAPLPHVTALAGGGFVVAWDSYYNDQRGFSISDIFFQRFDAAGRPQDGMVQANVASGGGRFDAAVTALSDGGFLVAWQGDDGAGNGVYGRRFGADGNPVDLEEFSLNQLRAGEQTSPDVTALAGGGFAAAWVDMGDDGQASIEVRVLPGSTGAASGGGAGQYGGASGISAPGTPVTTAPVTAAPAPATSAPVTSAPVTSAPVTSTPVTSAPVTSTPVTSTPSSSAPIEMVASVSASHAQLVAPSGAAAVKGAAGIDTVIYGGAHGAYTVAKNGDKVVVSNGSGTSTTLSNVERIQFGDQSLALDTEGNAGDAYRLYQAAFNRSPDKTGLGFWINALDTGHGLHEAAQAFVNSTEFVKLYGANTSDAQFLQAVYQNVLHRTPDASGYAFWLDALKHVDRAQILVDFSQSTENRAQVASSIKNGIEFTKWTEDTSHDTVMVAGARASYAIVKNGDDVVVKGTGTSMTLNNVERLQFGDKMVALDIDGHAGDAYRLYQAAFDRAPDETGLGFWIDALDTGHSLHEAAQAFVNSAEFAKLYGANTSDTQFLDAVYQNVLHRAPDASGYAFWLDAMKHVDRAQVLVDFSQSAENQAQIVGSIQNGIDFIHWG
ncbi:DUF4214 domain-containing protein [Massilia sp. YIM B02763]|uniref:DUF4214 domain-containing protein n=1 Tax=Massilia sp. YIM B02763 TaxID=3050130 RepID=UPI0025B668CF|nr:DUF4214 domain-containing protein [Massilia sp. YIM B02763]MDN4052384.1 DUF4214 domain-containing protein [Massilia sp. YIM B02763]